MSAEAVVLQHAAPVRIDHLLALFLRPNAVHPVILIGKTASRPTQERNLHLPQCVHHIRAHAVYVLYAGIRTNVQSLVDSSSKMLRKLPLNFRIDVSLFLLLIDQNFCHEKSFLSNR